MSVLSILNQLTATTKRTEKMEILRINRDNLLLRQAFYLALNPLLNFYIKKIPEYTKNETKSLSLNVAFNQLLDVSNRDVTGNAAIDKVANILSNLNSDDAEVFTRVIKRDMRCGVSTTSVNKIWPKLIPEFPYQRCSLLSGVNMDKWDWGRGVYSQLKADGSFANLIILGGHISIMTRTGSVYPEAFMQNIRDDLDSIYQDNQKDIVIHGELLVYTNGGLLPREIGNGKLNSLLSDGISFNAEDSVKCIAWDVISYDEFLNGYSATPYSSRFDSLCKYLDCSINIEVIDTALVMSFDEAILHYKRIVETGGEGTIIKLAKGIWKNGTSKEQVKLKQEIDIELKMTNLTEGYGKNSSTFGSVTCASSDGEFEVNVSGFTDAARKDLFDNWNSYEGKIITVRINGIMAPTDNNPKYSGFLPRFIEHRNDKTDADSLDKIKETVKGASYIKK